MAIQLSTIAPILSVCMLRGCRLRMVVHAFIIVPACSMIACLQVLFCMYGSLRVRTGEGNWGTLGTGHGVAKESIKAKLVTLPSCQAKKLLWRVISVKTTYTTL